MGNMPPITTETNLLARLLSERTAALSGPDRDIIVHFLNEQIVLLAQNGTANLPVVLGRLYEVAGCLRDLMHMEDAFEKEPTPAHYETLGKTRDRFRKAMKEFEDSVLRVGLPTGHGFADALRPLIKKSEGVFHALLASPKTEYSQENKNDEPRSSDTGSSPHKNTPNSSL